MKKMKWTAVFAALVSALGLSSCLDNGDSGPQQLQWPVNVDDSYLGASFTPDINSGIKMTTDVADLTRYGIPEGTKRAVITYTIPEGQEITETSKSFKIMLSQGLCSPIPVGRISNRPDTLMDYTSKFVEFMKDYPVYGFPAVYTNGKYLMINCSYQADEIGKLGLLPNRVSETKDTLYLDLKLKTKDGFRKGSTYFMANYDLTSCQEVYNMIPSNPTKDSIYVTVRAVTSMNGFEKMDSMTVKAINRFY